ncbi:MAG: ATP synthase F1 subunit delta [Candidatus Methylomirabilales bacterium]
MIAGSVAKRYAKALVEVATEADALESVGAELSSVATLWDAEPAMTGFFSNPGVLLKDKAQTLTGLARQMELSPLLSRFLDLLLTRDRLQALPAISRVYQDLMNTRLGRAQAVVTTTAPLAPDLTESLRRQMTEVLGKSVLLESKVEPAILGGIVVQVNSTVYDGSLRTQLRQLREHLLRE